MSPQEKQFPINNGSIQTGITRQGAFEPLAFFVAVDFALKCGYPERFAMENLGQNSKAVHRAYAKRALMKLPSLEEYERQAAVGHEDAG